MNPEKVKSFNEQVLKMRGIVDYNKRSLTDEFFILNTQANGKKNISSYVKIELDKGILGWLKDVESRYETDYIPDLVSEALLEITNPIRRRCWFVQIRIHG